MPVPLFQNPILAAFNRFVIALIASPGFTAASVFHTNVFPV